jgi:hypothetical protein
MTLRPVRKGEVIVMPVCERDGTRGGFTRRPAPGDGAAWDAGDSCGFVSVEELEAALVGLGRVLWTPKKARRR